MGEVDEIFPGGLAQLIFNVSSLEMIIAGKKLENFSSANWDSVFSGNVKSLLWKKFFRRKNLRICDLGDS